MQNAYFLGIDVWQENAPLIVDPDAGRSIAPGLCFEGLTRSIAAIQAAFKALTLDEYPQMWVWARVTSFW